MNNKTFIITIFITTFTFSAFSQPSFIERSVTDTLSGGIIRWTDIDGDNDADFYHVCMNWDDSWYYYHWIENQGNNEYEHHFIDSCFSNETYGTPPAFAEKIGGDLYGDFISSISIHGRVGVKIMSSSPIGFSRGNIGTQDTRGDKSVFPVNMDDDDNIEVLITHHANGWFEIVDWSGGPSQFYALENPVIINGVFDIDIDSDGDTDLITSDGASNTLWLADTPLDFNIVPFPATLQGLYLRDDVDMNSDGNLDLIVFSDSLYWVEHIGDLNFELHTIGPGSGFEIVKAVDLDLDLDLDIVTINPGITWYENTGNVNFAAPVELTDESVGHPKLIDIDNDEDLDIAAASASWWENMLGEGVFPTPEPFELFEPNDESVMFVNDVENLTFRWSSIIDLDTTSTTAYSITLTSFLNNTQLETYHLESVTDTFVVLNLYDDVFSLEDLADTLNVEWSVESQTNDDVVNCISDFSFDIIPLDAVDNFSSNLPLEFRILDVYPNPFNSTTTVSITIPEADYISVRLYNTLGERIPLHSTPRFYDSGRYKLSIDCNSIAAGIYYVNINYREKTQTRKLLLLR